MYDILYQYNLDFSTWVYLSSLLIVTLYFKFNSLWRFRNLDVLLLVAVSPGVLMIREGGAEPAGYVWLFAVGLLFLVRLLLDSAMIRRPLLEPNLNTSGLTFLGTALLVFLISQVATRAGPRQTGSQPPRPLPEGRFPLLDPLVDSQAEVARRDESRPDAAVPTTDGLEVTGRTLAIVSQFLIVIGLVLAGQRHFGNVGTGIGMATLYLLFPPTALLVGRADHALPAACLLWAVVSYRFPLLAGLWLGAAGGLIYYPLLLLPLWAAFYWERGLIRILIGTAIGSVVIIAVGAGLVGFGAYAQSVGQAFGLDGSTPETGLWGTVFDPVYRLPVEVAYVVMCGSFALWPPRKNLGTLMSCSAAVLLGTQLWQPHGGGTYIGWYLPILLLTVFRPNLEERVALTSLRLGGKAASRPVAARQPA